MVKKYNLCFVDIPRIFIISNLSIRKPGPSSVLIISEIALMSDEDPGLRIKSFEIIETRGESTKYKLNIPKFYTFITETIAVIQNFNKQDESAMRTATNIILIQKNEQKSTIKILREIYMPSLLCLQRQNTGYYVCYTALTFQIENDFEVL